MPLSNYALDTFVSDGLSKLTEANAVPIGPDLTGHARWIATFVLNRIFLARVSEDRAALAFAMLRRAEAAVEDYDAGCAALSDLVGGEKSISAYFRCLRRFEGALPPLDSDFFTQAQRLSTKKPESLIDKLVEDVVTTFGSNFCAYDGGIPDPLGAALSRPSPNAG